MTTKFLAITAILATLASTVPAAAQQPSQVDAIAGYTCSGRFTTPDPKIYGGFNFSFKKEGPTLIAVVHSDQGQNASQNHENAKAMPHRGNIAVKVSGSDLVIDVPRPESPGNFTSWAVKFDPATKKLTGTNNRRVTIADGTTCRN